MSSTTTVSPSLIIGSYANTSEPGIYLVHYDNSKNTLNTVGTFAGVVNPSFVAAHPHQSWLYAVSETNAGSVWSLRLDDHSLVQAINQQPSGGDAPCHLELDAAGRWLLVSNYGSGTVGVLPILDDGALGEMTDLVQHRGSGVNAERQDGPHAHSATFTPDQRWVIVADLGIDRLMVYAFDSAAGKLREHAQIVTQPGAGPRHMAFHLNGRWVYVANELSSTVSLYDYDAAVGALRERQTIDTVPQQAEENMVAAIRVAPSGRQVYVSNRGHNSITVFDIEATGRLTSAAIVPCGGDWPRDFTLTPDGGALLVANERSDQIAIVRLGAEPTVVAAASVRVTRPSSVRFHR